MNPKAEQWLKEAFPIPAGDATSSANVAARHSFQKWLMVRQKLLEEYGLYASSAYIRAKQTDVHPDCYVAGFYSMNCSLCRLTEKISTSRNGCYSLDCNDCQFTKIHGNHCGKYWSDFSCYNNPEPMIKKLYEVAYYSFPVGRPFTLWAEPYRPIDEHD